MNNKFYIDNNSDFNKEQLVNMKKNHYYLSRALTYLCKTTIENDDKIGGPFRPALLLGELQRNDMETGFNTNNLADKLKFLTIALSDKSHPENREKFKKSFLCQNVLLPLMKGYILDDKTESWRNYKHTTNFDKDFKNKSSVDAAYICRKDDLNEPVGLDFSKLIDTLVKTAGKGRYYIDDSYTIDDEIAMSEAVNIEIKTLKGNKRFKESYSNQN